MAFWSRREKRISSQIEWGSSRIPLPSEAGGNPIQGVFLTESQALGIATVYTCISIISDAIATLPFQAYKRTKDNSKVIIDPTPPIIANPWPEGSVMDYVTQICVSLLLRGNFYGVVGSRDARGFPTSIVPIHPDAVNAWRDVNTGARVYRVNGKIVDTSEILHIPYMLVPGSFIGMNPVEYARLSWGGAMSASTYASRFFTNSANPSGILTTDQDLSPEQAKEMANQWMAVHQGVNRSNMPAVMTGGVSWHQIALNHDDMQFLQTREFSRDEIASWFRVPAHLLNQQDRTSSWGTGIEQMEMGFRINTLQPIASRIEAYHTKMLPGAQLARFDFDERLRADALTRWQSYTLAANAGVLNANEIRDKEGMPHLPKDLGDHYWRPVNFAPVDKILDGTANVNGGPGGGIANGPNNPAPKADTTDGSSDPTPGSQTPQPKDFNSKDEYEAAVTRWRAAFVESSFAP
jgi:HK97 family phage portal protein